MKPYEKISEPAAGHCAGAAAGPAAFRCDAAENDVVYLSISFDGTYIDDKNGDTMVYLPISLD